MRRPVTVEADDLRSVLDGGSMHPGHRERHEAARERVARALDAADLQAVPVVERCGCRPGHECGTTGPVPPPVLAPGVVL